MLLEGRVAFVAIISRLFIQRHAKKYRKERGEKDDMEE